MNDENQILLTNARCFICGAPLSPEQPDVLERVSGFQNQTKTIVTERHGEFAHRECLAVLTWGLVDKYSWLNSPDPDSTEARKHQREHRPLPFNDRLMRKPMWHAIARAFAAAPKR